MKRASKILAWLVIIHSVLFLIFWLTNTAFQADTNDFLTDLIGPMVDYIFYCLLFSIGLLLWSVILFIYHRDSGKSSVWWIRVGDWIYCLLGVIFLVFFYGSFSMLFNEAPVQKIRLFQMLDYFRVILDPLLLLATAVLGAFWIRKKQLDWKRAAPILILLVSLWSVALIFPPGSVIRGILPDKPLLIAHRGASALAPENTQAAAQKAADLGIFGQETDVQVSADGQLFLMHDDTLIRTTNVAGIYPQRAKNKAGSFKWTELKKLDAGSWFEKNDPFGSIKDGIIDPAQIQSYSGESIPTFQEWLDVIKKSGGTFLYDIKSTRDMLDDQPVVYEAALKAIAEAGVADQAWILADPDQTVLVRQLLPDAKLTFGVNNDSIHKAIKLNMDGYEVVNAEYTLPAKSLLDFKKWYWVNIYTVDEAWQYSRMWILGVDSVTTNNLTGLMALKQPVFSVPYIIYALLLVIAGAIAIGINRLLERPSRR
jgi:glycerophosphoryl diester phosphodiesterase